MAIPFESDLKNTRFAGVRGKKKSFKTVTAFSLEK